MLATLLLTPGTPLLLAGDELGNTQNGNNNAYAQDNETGWLAWDGSNDSILDDVRRLIALRKSSPVLQRETFRHGERGAHDLPNILWLTADGHALNEGDWHGNGTLVLLLSDETPEFHMQALLLNSVPHEVTVSLSALGDEHEWHICYSSAEIAAAGKSSWRLPPRSLACVRSAVETVSEQAGSSLAPLSSSP